MMKLILANLAMAIAMTMGIDSVTQLPTGEDTQPVEEKSTTEFFVVDSITEDGYANAMPITESELENGYILDPIYNIGDIVQVTYWNDDILSERVITGDELVVMRATYNKEIKTIMDKNNEYVQAEDGSYVQVAYYE